MSQLTIHEERGADMQREEGTGIVFRYSLHRIWDYEKPLVMFVGLNPSTANENDDDPTIRRVRRFASDWGFGGFYMVNCFPMVTPKPEELQTVNFDINLMKVKSVSEKCSEVIFTWGNFKEVPEHSADEIMAGMFPNAKCLGKNANGSPKHPLYLKADTIRIPYNE